MFGDYRLRASDLFSRACSHMAPGVPDGEPQAVACPIMRGARRMNQPIGR